ncbi:DNA-binding transcriptional activator of the SARP family [Thermanaerovibrio velox DSM 12556]|uniref:DNA-binding transcriptional activator of the SARP family n=1 Tax=Thermanaerovibrio velox DSM 12556 TaxID=926567 RepID=H0UQB4_9BACT|nr:BTAD domain-containing putative transcriptional regulator [Thermanaerovibrio velox]EHM10752.1 DNA-binding transcriptional activator of the SARP family [Thermanaerovibrio velox DSM 12556]
MLKVTLAGPPSVDMDGERVRFPFRKLEAMAYVLFDQVMVPRDRLCRLLWGDKDLPVARKNLRNAVYVLRRLLPPGMVVLHRDLVSLDLPEGTVDLHMMDRFLSLSDDDREALGREFLEGFDLEGEEEFRRWLSERRVEHRRRFTALARELGAELLRKGDPAGATRWFERVFALDPLDEVAARSLMELYHRSGWAAGPVEVFNALKERLARDYGIMPSPETVELFSRISASRRAFNDFHAIVPPVRAAAAPAVSPASVSRRGKAGDPGEGPVRGVAGPSALDLASKLLSQDGGGVLLHLPSPSPNPLLSCLETFASHGEAKVDRLAFLGAAELAGALAEELARRGTRRVLVNLRDRLEGASFEFLKALLTYGVDGKGLGLLIASPDPGWLSAAGEVEVLDARQDPGPQGGLESLWGSCLCPLGAVWEEVPPGEGNSDLVVSCRDPMSGTLWLAPRDQGLRRKALEIMPDWERRRRAQRSLSFWLGRCMANHLDTVAWEMGTFYGGLLADPLVEGYCSAMWVRARAVIAEAGLAGGRRCPEGPSEEEVRRAASFLRSSGGPALQRVKGLALRISPL